MTTYKLTPSESKANPCVICRRPATFVTIRNSGKITFGCRNCFR